MTDKDYGPWIPVDNGAPDGVTTESGENWQLRYRDGDEITLSYPIQECRKSLVINHIRLRADHPYYRHEWKRYSYGVYTCTRCDAIASEGSRHPIKEFDCVPKKTTEPAKPTPQIVRPSVDDPWIEWRGSECPIKDLDAVVEVKYRDGCVSVASNLHTYRWRHDGNDSDIIAYRVLRSSCPEDYEMPKKPVVRVEWEVRSAGDEAWAYLWGSLDSSIEADYYLRTELHDGAPVSVRLMTREEAMREVEG